MSKKVGSGSLVEARKRKKKSYIALVVCALLLWNTVSFALMRTNPEGYKAKLIPVSEDVQSKVVNYLLAGTLNQAEAVFEQYLPEFEGSVVYVNCQMHGWDPKIVAEQIAADIDERQAEARIWAISVSSQVAHLVDAQASGVKIVAINPCTTEDCLAPQFRGYNWLAWTLRGLGYGLGWLSALPMIPLAGVDTNTEAGKSGSSLILLLDQLVAITNGIDMPRPYAAETVIVSRHDQLLDTAAEKALYAESAQQILEIEADHAGTMVYAEAYRAAFRASGLTK